MSIVIDRMPRIFRKGGVFSPTGTIVHDDKTDFAGTFVNMLDYYDKLEMGYWKDTFEQDVVGQNPSRATEVHEHAGTTDVTIVSVPIKHGSRAMRTWDNSTSNDLWVIYQQPSPLTDTIGRVRFWLRLGSNNNNYLRCNIRDGSNNKIMLYFVKTDASYWRWYYYDGSTQPLEGDLLYNVWYLFEVQYNLTTDKFDAYRNGNLVKANCNFFATATQLDVIQYYSAGSTTSTKYVFVDTITWYLTATHKVGSYTSQSIYMDGATWGKFSWTENLDGATIVGKVRGSDNGSDWTEWQTVPNGDYIALGQKDYLQYKFEVTNGTDQTYIDDVVIEYAI